MTQRLLFDDNFDSPLRQSLEASLVEDPDDRSAHMAYADHLQELGDPRGELIQVQLALEDETLPADQRRSLREREMALLSRHDRAWLGELAPFTEAERGHERVTVGWWRGWIDSLTVPDMSCAIARALQEPRISFRLLRELRILDCDYWDESAEPVFDMFRRAGIFRNIRVFQLGTPDDNPLYSEDDEVVPLVEQMPALEELILEAREVVTERLFSLPLPHLRKLTVHHQSHYPLETLAANESLVSVTHLAFWPHALLPRDDGHGPYLPSEGIREILRAPAFRSLTHLQLRLTNIGDDLIRELIAQGRFQTLRVLDLWGGRVTDAGAHLLAECRDARRLEKLDLSYNGLTATGLAELREAGITVTGDNQYTQRDLDDRRHLYHGDWE
jgi:uncharacterized protein (TIGR02996 family)